MHRKRAVLALLAGLLVAGTVRAEVDAKFSGAFDFSAYSTYAWHEGTPARRDVAERRIRSGVDRELAAAGLRRVDEGADVWVVTHVLVDRHTLDDLSDRDYWEFYTGVRSVDAFDVAAGTLVIDLVDAELERVVWRAAASDAVRGGMEANMKKIDKLIRKMFKRLPR